MTRRHFYRSKCVLAGARNLESHHCGATRTPLIARPPTYQVQVSDDGIQMLERVGASVSGRQLRAGLICARRRHLRSADARKLVEQEQYSALETSPSPVQSSGTLCPQPSRFSLLTAATFARHLNAHLFSRPNQRICGLFILRYTNALIIIIRPHRPTTYVAYCCRRSSLVCRSVCLSVGLSQS